MFLGKRVKRLSVALLIYVATGPLVHAACTIDRVSIKSGASEVRFTVEVAQTDQERAVGLMNRKSMPKSSGMLFVFPSSGPVSFWMRNTYIPLDMIFLDDRGIVKKVHEAAVPLDETPIHGGNEIKLVLEINAGLAKRYRISTGSLLQHPLVGHNAAWPCD